MALLLMPYTNLHELNLDWIINALKESGVLSVNGETGIVVLYKEANIQLPDIPTDLNWSIKRKTNGTNVGIKFNKAGPLQRIYGNSEFAVYDTGNPPPYPVASVNGQTGAVVVPVAFDSMSGDLLNVSTVSPDHSWTLNRKTRDGDIAITLDSTGDNAEIRLDYVNNDESVDESVKILTEKDIPPITAFNGDCNNLTTNKTVYVTNQATNRPGDWYFISTMAIESADATVQMAYGAAYPDVKIRKKTMGTWSEWKTFIAGGSVEATVPVGTQAGSYKIGTFTSLNIPANANITSVICTNATSSVCVVTGVSISGQDIYVYLAEEVTTGNGQIRVSYTIA